MLLTRDGVVLLAATFCYLASTMLANPLVAGFAGALGATAAMMGVLTALMNACSLVVRPVAGNLADSVSRGNAVGSMQVQVRGDNEGLPTREQLAAFMGTEV